MPFRSRQREMGGGKFRSEAQRRAMFANAPRAAAKWAENRRTNRSDWIGMSRTKLHPTLGGTAKRGLRATKGSVSKAYRAR